MSKKLYLIRHSYAETSNDKPDVDRKLTLEGQSKVRALGRYLIKREFNPDIIFSSSAVRTRETAIILVEELGINEHIIEFNDVIYTASVREILAIINGIADHHQSIALIGHNPVITFFGEYITSEPVNHMDPIGVVTITFKKRKWSKISQGTGIFEGYYHPDQVSGESSG